MDSSYFQWYVELHITPHGLRVMALRSWRTLICWLEAPKGQRSQSACKEEIIYIIKWSDKVKEDYLKWSDKVKDDYLNNKVKWKNQRGLFK